MDRCPGGPGGRARMRFDKQMTKRIEEDLTFS